MCAIHLSKKLTDAGAVNYAVHGGCDFAKGGSNF